MRAACVLLTLCVAGHAASQMNGQEARPIKVMGEETSLSRLKADPKAYLDRGFIVTGGAIVDDYFNFGYLNAADSHYSLEFREVLAGPPAQYGETCHLYLPKNLPDGLSNAIIDKITPATTNNKLTRMRAKVRLESSRYESGHWELLELHDVQFAAPDGSGWLPWVVESHEEEKRASELAASKAARDEKSRREAESRRIQAEQRAADTREWSDATGKFSVKAQFAGLRNGKVALLRDDGWVVTVELDKLSQADREWVKKRTAK